MTATNDGIINLKGVIKNNQLVALLDHTGKDLGTPVTSKVNEVTGGSIFSLGGKPIPGVRNLTGLPKLLTFGCSIAQQCNAYMAASTSTVSGDHKAGVNVLNVVNGAAFSPGQKISMPLYNARIWTTTINSIATNALTLADYLPGFVRTGSAVTINTTGTVPSLMQGYGAINAAVALLGGPVEVLPSFGYGGAICQAMVLDLERDLRYYRPHYVGLHMFENDLTGTPASSITLEQMKGWARHMANLCLQYGAVPIVYSSMPYYNGSSGIRADRAADFDGLLDYLTKIVSNGKSQFELDVPGAIGDDLSTPWLDPAYLNDPTFSRRPLPGWTDGVHPNSNKRFAVGQFAVPKLKKLLPTAGSRLDLVANKRENAALSGTGGTAVGSITGVIPADFVAGTFGAAVMQTSRNADGSLNVIGTWPGAAARNTDYIFARYPIWMPGVWAWTPNRFKVYAKIRINSMVGIGQVFAEAVIAPTGEDHSGSFGVDCAKSMPADGTILCIETPHFACGQTATSITPWLTIKPTDAGSPANASIDIDILELGLIQCVPETPHGFI